ncbi:MAG: double zinc ribbon domain-containing protein [Patescibacteria group bacterium]
MKGLYESLLDILFPKTCASCGASDSFFCEPCERALHIFSPQCLICGSRNMDATVCLSCRRKTALSHFYAPFSYKDVGIRNAIHRLKYDRMKWYGPFLGSFIATGLSLYKVRVPKNTICIPIPLYSSRERKRGFNQSELIAESLCEHLGIPLEKNILFRIKETKSQVELNNHTERAINMNGAFSIERPELISQKTIFLIDDVATSGATLNEAAFALKSARARSVWGLTTAH